MRIRCNIKICFALALCVLLAMAACAPKVDETLLPIPEDAFVYASITDLETNWNSMAQTDFFKEMAALKIWEQPNVKQGLEEMKKALEEIEESIGVPLNKQNFMAIFGKKVDIAIIPADKFPHAIAVLDLGVKATAMKIINKVKTKTDKDSIETTTYEKMEITRIPVEDAPVEIAYFFYGDRLIITTQLDAAKAAIDCLVSKKKTILDNANYLETGKRLGELNNLVYIDTIQFETELAKVAEDMAGEFSNAFKGYSRFSSGWNWENKKFNVHTVALVKEDSGLGSILGNNEIMKTSAKWIPDNPLMASSGAIDWKKFYEFQKDNLQSMESPAGPELWTTITDGFKEFLGTDLEQEINDWAGKGAVFMFQNLNSQGMFPVPETVFGIGVSDEAKALAFMNRVEGTLTAQFADKHLQFSTREINEIEFRFIQMPLGQNLAPGYAVINDYLVIASSPVGFTESLNTWKGDRKSVFDTKKFNETTSIDIDDIVAFQYVDSENIMMSIAGLVDTYRMFFPEDLNPDDVKKAIETFALVRSARTNVIRDGNWIDYGLTVNIQ